MAISSCYIFISKITLNSANHVSHKSAYLAIRLTSTKILFFMQSNKTVT